MNVQAFFEKFDLLSNAPDIVPSLRELVLQLAIRGKLVTQRATDESAVKLVCRAKAYAAKLAKVGRIQKVAQDWTPDEAYLTYELPAGWVWTCNAIIGDSSPRNDVPDDIRVGFAPMHLIPTDYRAEIVVEDRRWGDIKKGFTHFADGDIAVAKITPCFQNGKACVLKNLPKGVGAGTTELHVLRPYSGTVDPLYMLLFFRSPDFVTGGVSTFTGTAGQQRVSNDYFRFRPIPLPPLAEQKRIVAKVDELMALCDRLEAQQQERQTRHGALARASLARFADEPTPDNLNFLFHKSYTIEPHELRKAILVLAVQGKLVDHEQIENLSCNGHSERGQFIDGGKTRAFPKNWALTPLAEVADEIIDCPHSTPKWTTTGKLCIRTNQFSPGHLDLSESRFVSEETFHLRIQRLRPTHDDVLYSREGGILGVACRVPPDIELCLGQRMMLIRAGRSIRPAFLELVLNSPLITSIAHRKTTGGAAPRVNVSTVRAYPIPVPPLEEQQRILAKVDQLLALVDQLESQLTASRATAARLLDAIVAELTAADQRKIRNDPTIETRTPARTAR